MQVQSFFTLIFMHLERDGLYGMFFVLHKARPCYEALISPGKEEK